VAIQKITTGTLGADSVTAAQIAPGTIVPADLADDAVTTAKILNANVTTAKITDANVTTAKVADDAVTLAKMAPGTDGNIISYDASGNPVAVVTGTAGQLLTSAGAGAPPTFTTVSSGGMTLLSTLTTTSGTEVTTATLDLSTYKTLQVFIWSVGNSAGTTGRLQWKNNGGSYAWISNAIATIDAAYGFLNHDLTTGVFLWGRSEARVPAETVQNLNGAAGIGVNQITTTTTSISFSWTGTETFDSGTIKIYGLK